MSSQSTSFHSITIHFVFIKTRTLLIINTLYLYIISEFIDNIMIYT